MASPSSNNRPSPAAQGDIFDPLLSLEDQYYTEGHTLGVADGSRSGRIEGRLFGLEKGFDKAMAMGKLHGRAQVWSARLPPPPRPNQSAVDGERGRDDGDGDGDGANYARELALPQLSNSNRLRKHIDRLRELTDPQSLETQNTEDAVNEFDERLAGANSKATLIAKIVGSSSPKSSTKVSPSNRGPKSSAEAAAGTVDASEGNEVEMVSGARPASRKAERNGGGSGGKQTGEMEDFMGLPQARQKSS
ncbi:hypothetical protein LTR85_011615 [Meristemomyces frigidus]|nr:hypothetical protein LTR85_011615 [Meristemomyces frigidus]